METSPGSVTGLPLTAASSPRLALRLSDSCGVIIGSWVSVSVLTGIDVEALASSLERQGSITLPHREGDVFVFGQAPSGDTNADTWSVTQVSAAPFVELLAGCEVPAAHVEIVVRVK